MSDMHNNVDEYQKCMLTKRIQTLEYLLYNSIYMKLYSMQNYLQ